jgi:hypothetical protein
MKMVTKGLKLKEGKDVLEEYMTDDYLTKEEWMKKDKKIFFFQPKTEMSYTIIYNFSEPKLDFSDYLKDGVSEKDVMENVGSLTLDGTMDKNHKMFIEKGDVLGRQKHLSDFIFHYFLKGRGRRLVGKLYDVIGSDPSCLLYENNENLCDIFFEVTKESVSIIIGDSEEGKKIVDDLKEEYDLSKMDGGSILSYPKGVVFSDTGLSKTELDNITETRKVMEKIKKWDYEIGRNDKCPCGSGLKFKRCCIN